MPSEIVHFDVSQHPDPVKVGEKVHVVCKATTLENKELTFYPWTDQDGAKIKDSSVMSENGNSTLSVVASTAMVVRCRVAVDGKEKPEVSDYPIHIGESCANKMEYHRKMCVC